MLTFNIEIRQYFFVFVEKSGRNQRHCKNPQKFLPIKNTFRLRDATDEGHFVALNCSQYYKYKKRQLPALNFTKIVQINREIKILETSLEKVA